MKKGTENIEPAAPPPVEMYTNERISEFAKEEALRDCNLRFSIREIDRGESTKR